MLLNDDPKNKPLDKRHTMDSLNRFLCEDDGQDMVEYALLASFISIVAIVSISTIGPLIRALYQNIHIAIRFARDVVGI